MNHEKRTLRTIDDDPGLAIRIIRGEIVRKMPLSYQETDGLGEGAESKPGVNIFAGLWRTPFGKTS